MTSVKSNEVLFKLHQDTGKAKIFAVQMKSKLRERERERERERVRVRFNKKMT